MNYHTDPEILATFEEEVTERLAEIEMGLLALERGSVNPSEELVHSIFRSAHSIKAGANLLKFNEIEQLSHRAEHILQRMRTGELTPTPDIITDLLEAFDGVRELVLAMHPGAGPAPDVSLNIARLDKHLH